jgi:spore maturation protein CgeB
MLAPDTTEHRQFFQEGRNIFLFKDVKECRDKIQHLLGIPAFEADIIRADARHHSLISGYTYKDRATFAWKEMKELYA